MRSVTFKLAIGFVAVALVGVLIVGYLANRFTTAEFGDYLVGGGLSSQQTAVGGMMGRGSGGGSTMADAMRQMMQVAGSPERRFLDSVNRSLWLAGGIALAAALLLGFLLSRQITAPLKRLTLASQRVAAGDFSQRVDLRSRDELAALAKAFNGMAGSLARNEEQRKQLLSDIAHELKTPLSIIQGNLEAMVDGVVEATPERLVSLQEETQLLGRLVTDLRDLSLAEAGHLPLHLQPFDLGELVRGTVSGIQPQGDERGVRLETELPEELPRVFGDPDRVGQVLRNLMSNALRYTPSGGAVRVSAKSPLPLGEGQGAATATANCVQVTVSDTGSGIPAEELPWIFDRFYRVDKSRARSSGGSGLGLSVAKQLIEAQGGSIWAESEPGRGSAFHFTLPLLTPTAESARTA